MSTNAQRVKFENLRSLAFGSISGTFAEVGPIFANPARLLKIDNSTDANVIISFDGVNNHVFIPAISSVLFDYASDRVGPEDRLEQPVGTPVYVKQESGAPTSGHIYVSLLFAASN